MARGRFRRRAVLRAAMGSAIAAVATAPPRVRRHRAPLAAGALIAGAAMESPATGVVAAAAVAAAVLGAETAISRRNRAQKPLALAAGAAGVGIAFATRRLWPVAPKDAATVRRTLTPIGGEPTDDGDGITFVVNPSAGPALSGSPTVALREAFPKATVLEIGETLDLATALRQAGTTAKAVGVAGGDGTISAAAAVAHVAGKPLVVVPAGTLNHLARDLGLQSTDDAVAAVKEGDLVAVDIASIDGKTFVNTASFGAYTELVDARERLEARIGKWPAMLVALVGVLRRTPPLEVELDGRRRRLWMIFIGNCLYHPAGFAPSWRERLDDGELDVRLVDADHSYARLRLLAAVVTGRLGRCVAYEAFTTKRLHVRSLDGRLRLARDGETFDGSAEFEVVKEDRPLALYVRRSDLPT